MKKERKLRKKIELRCLLREFRFILLLASIALFFFIAGLIVGFNIVLDRFADIAARFIKVDENIIKQALFQYKENIGACFPNAI